MNAVVEKYLDRLVRAVRSTSEPQEKAPPSAEKAMETLSSDLKARLGALVDAPVEVAELAIGLFPYGDRALLRTYGVIELEVGGEVVTAENKDSPRRRVRLLDQGRNIIAACADPPPPLDAPSEVDARRLREQYEPDLPFEVEETEA